MTSLQATGSHYASSFNALPLVTSCRYHEDSESKSTGTSTSTSISAPMLPGPCYSHVQSTQSSCSLNSNSTTADWNTVLRQPGYKLSYAAGTAGNTLPLHTDPEMYALRNNYSTSESNAYFAQQHQHQHQRYHRHPPPHPSLPAVTAAAITRQQPSPTMNSRLAYVEALVDTNAHVIETIWSGASSNWNKSAVVPLRTFIQEVLKRSRTTYSTLQTALFYLFRARSAIVAQLYGQRNMDDHNRGYPQWQDAYISCGRRMFLASLVVASKFVQDKTYRNSAWAKIAGLPVSEINASERIFLDLIEYNLYIAQATFEKWHQLLHLHVEARAHNQPVFFHDLSSLHSSLSQQQHSLPSPTSPSSSPSLHWKTTTTTTTTTTHPEQLQQHSQQQTRRKRRFRETSSSGDYHHPFPYLSYSSPSVLSPATSSPSSHIPPVLSLSLPSSSNSSPMHTPTQVSPVRNMTFSWKMSPATECAPSSSSKKRRVGTASASSAILENDFSSTNGYAVSHVRGIRITQQHRKSRRQEA